MTEQQEAMPLCPYALMPLIEQATLTEEEKLAYVYTVKAGSTCQDDEGQPSDEPA